MASDKRASRRRYSEEIKAVMAECEAAGASVAKVAMSHDINANIVHRWRQLAREARPVQPGPTGEFVPVSLATPPTATGTDDIQIQLRRGTTTMTITWPVSAAADLGVWMRDPRRHGMAGRRAAGPARGHGVGDGQGAPRLRRRSPRHHPYLFANRRANRMKVLVHDGIGIWLAARRLHQGKFIRPRDSGCTLSLTRAQLEAFGLGLPWQRLGVADVISVL